LLRPDKLSQCILQAESKECFSPLLRILVSINLLPAVPARFASRNSKVTAVSQIQNGEETNEDVMGILLLDFKQFLCTIIDQLTDWNILAMLF